jgi:hypothetical protein
MKLEELVPPIDLCKKIPAGEFTDTAFQWQEVTLKDGSKGVDLIQHYPHEWHQPEWARLYPAPTLQEIMAELPPLSEAFWSDFNDGSKLWMVANSNYESNPNTAALEQWLFEKGYIKL